MSGEAEAMGKQAAMTDEALAFEEAKRRFLRMETEILSSICDVQAESMRLYWPDNMSMMGADDQALSDAIRENVPFGRAEWPPYEDLDGLFALQHASRLLVQYNEFAQGAIRNRKNFIVGYGCEISVAPKVKGDTLTDEEKRSCKEVIDAFVKRNKWRRRSRANQLRLDRDGEVFIRKFRTDAGLVLRYVEPEDVRPPNEKKMDHPFGIVRDPNDVEGVRAYWVAVGDEITPIPAEDIQFRKLDDDLGCERGVPLFVGVKRSLGGAAKVQTNVTALTKIQSAYGLLRKHAMGTLEQIQAAIANKAEVEIKNPLSGQTEYARENRPGKVVDVPPNVTYEFPSTHADPEKFLKTKDSNLRAAAAALAMPEYMFTADASNANMASTMVAESPATREFEACQWDAIEYDVELFEEEFDLAVARSVISQETRDKIQVVINPPSPAVRNDLEAATVREKDLALGVSRKTLIEESGRDYEVEEANNDDYEDKHGEIPGPTIPAKGSAGGAAGAGGKSNPASK